MYDNPLGPVITTALQTFNDFWKSPSHFASKRAQYMIQMNVHLIILKKFPENIHLGLSQLGIREERNVYHNLSL